MAASDQNRLKTFDKVLFVVMIANIFIVALTVLSYLRDGEFSGMSMIVGLTALFTMFLIRVGLHRKK